ncbi:MAG: ASKHA domain-containing protein [Eubacteriales bacterium]|nr:ASKHA domain-containing protein [Eubacteriales bacterium]
MNRFCEKVYLEMTPPDGEDTRSDRRRLLDALTALGYGDVQLTLPALRQLHPACLAGEYRVTAALVCREDGWLLTRVEDGDTRAHNYGLAADYGSTTIVMQLVDLNTGAVLAQASEANGQGAYGSDILTRITYTLEDPAHVDEMQRATVQTFDRLLERLTAESGIDAGECPALIVAGNTTMIHFLLGLNAWTVFAAPFAPVATDPGWFCGRELGMAFDGAVYFIPSASNYIGGDIVSGLLVLNLHRQSELGLFFDIGTNGELVIGNRDFLLAGAGAAGPALEGYISRFGMRAQDGAIDSVSIDGPELRCTTIGNSPPVGICGSGIIDLLAQMRLNGWINIAGEFQPDASPRIVYLDDEDQYAAVYATAEESATGSALYFSQTDIRQYLETKAAAHTMVDCLLESVGFTEWDIDRFYLSGAFGAHSDLESAITLGIFPDLPRERFHCIRNSSLDGARTLLLDRTRFADIRYFLENLYCVQFASMPDFTIRMHAAKFIPHTNMELYPSVQRELEKRGY